MNINHAFKKVHERERECVRKIVEMKEKDGTDLRVSKNIDEKISKRIKVQDALGILCNNEEIWVGFATDTQVKKLLKLVSSSYGWDQSMIHHASSHNGTDDSSIPPHEHEVDICKRLGCTFLKDSLKNLTKGEKLTSDIV